MEQLLEYMKTISGLSFIGETHKSSMAYNLTKQITKMKHQMEIEERYFSEDIKSLKLYDEGFAVAYDNGNSYRITISLNSLATLCPRKYVKRQMYERLVAFLRQKQIELLILSRKKDKSIKKEVTRIGTCDLNKDEGITKS